MYPVGVYMCVLMCSARVNKQTDQTTTLCVQEVEIYLERWEVLGALVVVCLCLFMRARDTTLTNTDQLPHTPVHA